jgi:hypothetical protein
MVYIMDIAIERYCLPQREVEAGWPYIGAMFIDRWIEAEEDQQGVVASRGCDRSW